MFIHVIRSPCQRCRKKTNPAVTNKIKHGQRDEEQLESIGSKIEFGSFNG